MSNDESVIERAQSKHYCHTRFVERKGCLVWKISGFLNDCLCQNGQYIKSPVFSIPGDKTDWHLHMYPKGDPSSEGYVSLFLHSGRQDHSGVISCEFSILDVAGVKSKKKTFSRQFSGNFGFARFLSLFELENEPDLLPNDDLTLSCIVVKKIEKVGQCMVTLHEDFSRYDFRPNTLNGDLMKFFDCKRGTDVKLKVGSQEICAHKIVLMCRSPVFASMFEKDMLEKDTNEVAILDVEFDVLGELVHFMYTDEMAPRDVGFALKLLVAADMYEVPSLKARCTEYLSANVSLNDVFQVLKVASVCNERGLVQICTDIVEWEMSTSTSLTEWISKLKARPGELRIIEKLLKEIQSLTEDE